MKRFLSIAASTALLSTVLLADADNNPNTAPTAGEPNIALDGTGQFLIAPAFFAQDNFSTKLKVINTDTDSVVLVRAVVRDAVASQEIDFPICLTPGDVWTATLAKKGDSAVLTDTDADNSVYLPIMKNGGEINLPQYNPGAVGRFASGYVEFYPIAEVDLNDDQTTETRRMSPIDKKYCTAFFDYMASQTAGTVLHSVSTIPADGGTYGPLAAKEIRFVDDETLAGYVTVYNTGLKQAMTLPMMAFEDVIDVASIPSGIAITTAANTAPEFYLDPTGGLTTIPFNVDYLLQTNEVVVPFKNGGTNTLQLLTFWYDLAASQLRKYVIDVRDNAENTFQYVSPESFAVPNELGLISLRAGDGKSGIFEMINVPEASFSEGWLNIIKLENVLERNNQGRLLIGRDLIAPATIPTNMSAEQVDGSWTLNWMYNAKTMTRNGTDAVNVGVKGIGTNNVGNIYNLAGGDNIATH